MVSEVRKYINPFTDYGFKHIFGSEETKPFLIDFLNELMRDQSGFEQIVDISYKDKELPKVSAEERGSIFDILCVTSTGHKFIVEMQNNAQAYFLDRSVYYVSKAVAEQGKPGAWDFNYRPVFMVSFLNFTLSTLGDKVRTDAMICDLDTHEPVSDKMRYIYIQLPRFGKKLPEECVNAFDKWLYILINMETMNTMPFTNTDPIFMQLEKKASYWSLSLEERQLYDRSLKAWRDQQNQMKFAMTEARSVALAEGRAEGEIKGRNDEKIAIAKGLLAKGMPKDFILDVTHISEAEYSSLL